MWRIHSERRAETLLVGQCYCLLLEGVRIKEKTNKPGPRRFSGVGKIKRSGQSKRSLDAKIAAWRGRVVFRVLWMVCRQYLKWDERESDRMSEGRRGWLNVVGPQRTAG